MITQPLATSITTTSWPSPAIQALPPRLASASYPPQIDIALRHSAVPGSGPILLLGLISGVLSAFGFGLFFLPGLLFGVLVVGPWCHRAGTSPLITWLAVALAPLGYLAAFWSFFLPGGVLFAGGLGSALMFLPILVAGTRYTRSAAAKACLTGLILTPPFLFWPAAPLLVGLWQFCVAATLALAKQPRE